ncbi:MAG: 23S rRNA (guanosine(2251)-2'-O)-methyltransferase RlmB [Desulfobacteraceae bacterium]
MNQKSARTLIPGYQAVREALLGSTALVKEVWLSSGRRSQRVLEIEALAGERGVPVFKKDPEELDGAFPGLSHQGVAAVAGSAPVFAPVEDLVEISRAGDPPGLILAADHITDEGNLGALIRTAAFFGADGMVLPRDRSAGIGPAVLKRSAGALLRLPIARVVNLARALEEFKKRGFWVVGAAGEAQTSIFEFDWIRDTVLVIGREDKGLTKIVRGKCHALVSIPGAGGVESLNVAVAGGVILSEVRRQWRTLKGSAAGRL